MRKDNGSGDNILRCSRLPATEISGGGWRPYSGEKAAAAIDKVKIEMMLVKAEAINGVVMEEG